MGRSPNVGEGPLIHSGKIADLRKALISLIEKPTNWLVLEGPVGCGKRESLAHVCRETKLPLEQIDAAGIWEFCVEDADGADVREEEAYVNYLLRLGDECAAVGARGDRSSKGCSLQSGTSRAIKAILLGHIAHVMADGERSMLHLLTSTFLEHYQGPPLVLVCSITLEDLDSRFNKRVNTWTKSLLPPHEIVVFRAVAPTLLQKGIEHRLRRMKFGATINKQYVKALADAANGDLRYALNLADVIPEKSYAQLSFSKVERKSLFSVLGRAFYDKRINAIPEEERAEFERLRQEFTSFETQQRKGKEFYISEIWRFHFASSFDLWDSTNIFDTLNAPLRQVAGAILDIVTNYCPDNQRNRRSIARVYVIGAVDHQLPVRSLAADLDDEFFDDPPAKRRRYSSAPSSSSTSESQAVASGIAMATYAERYRCASSILNTPKFSPLDAAKVASMKVGAPAQKRGKGSSASKQLEPEKEVLAAGQIHGYYRLPSAEDIATVVRSLNEAICNEVPGMLATACTQRLQLEDATTALTELCRLNQVSAQGWLHHETIYADLAIRLVIARNVYGCNPIASVRESKDAQFDKCRYREAQERARANMHVITECQREMACRWPMGRVSSRKFAMEVLSGSYCSVRADWRKQTDGLEAELKELKDSYSSCIVDDSTSLSDIED